MTPAVLLLIKLFFKKYWKEVIIVALIASVVGGFKYEAARIKYLQNEIVKDDATIKQLKDQNAQIQSQYLQDKTVFNNTVKNQNDRIQQFLRDAQLQDARIKAAQGQADKVHVVYQDRVQTVYKQVVPKDCQSAINYLVDSVPDLK